MMQQAELMVVSIVKELQFLGIVDNLLNTVVQRGELRNVGCPVLYEVKCY